MHLSTGQIALVRAADAASTIPDESNGAVEVVACAMNLHEGKIMHTVRAGSVILILCHDFMNLHEGTPYGDKPYRPAEATFAHFAYLGAHYLPIMCVMRTYAK